MIHYWNLCFDNDFSLEPATGQNGRAGDRVAEEHLETILFRWGPTLLAAPEVAFLGRSSQLVTEQDLLGVDPLGRLHLFELKRDSAGAAEFNQLLAYLVNRPTREEDLQQAIADTLFHATDTFALRLAGLVAGELTKTMSHGQGGNARHAQRERGRLAIAAERASTKTGLALDVGTFERLAGVQIGEQFGAEFAAPVLPPETAFHRVTRAKFGDTWRFDRYRGPIAVWMVAPNLRGAIEAAEPLLAAGRGVDIRFVRVDVREVEPGRRWSIAVEHMSRDVDVDQLVPAAAAALDRHVQVHGLQVNGREYLDFNPSSGAVSLGWRLAGDACISFWLGDGNVSWHFGDHWWTEGEARSARDEVLGIKRHLASKHPSHWPWQPDSDGKPADELVSAMHALIDDAWRGLVAAKATDISKWAKFVPGGA